MIQYCAEKKIPIEASAQKPYSMDRNLLHISFEAGILEDPWFDAGHRSNRDKFTTLSVLPEDAPNQPQMVTVDFVRGNCVAVNGRSEPSSMTAFVSPSNSTGRTTMFLGLAEPRLEWTRP